jgi:hypothetical protein
LQVFQFSTPPTQLYPPASSFHSLILLYLGLQLQYEWIILLSELLKLSKHIYSKNIFYEGHNECFNMFKILFFLTLQFQNKIIIGHWDVELAVITHVFTYSIFLPECYYQLVSIPKKKIAINGDCY